jgi:APA family basic amino acid/polyamine antiporter
MIPGVPPIVSSILLVTLVTAVHLIDLGVSATFQNITTGLKFLLIALICYFGFRYAAVPLRMLMPSSLALKELFQPTSGVTLLFCYYSYSGWNASTYIADDVNASQRTVGRSLIIGSLFVMVVYLVMNAIFLLSAPVNELRGVLDVARVVAIHLLGQQGGRIMSAFIALGLIASISAMTWTGPRIMQMMGKNLSALNWFGKVSKKKIPLRAVLFQYAVVIALLLTSSFKAILVSTQFAMLPCELLAVISVIVLRKREKLQGVSKHMTFRSPLYPWPQLFFSIISVIALLYTLITNSFEALLGIVLILSALATYPILCGRQKIKNLASKYI